MKHSDLSLVVVGAGAIGGITAALLKKSDHNVEIICRDAEYASIISNEGIEVSGECKELTISMPAFHVTDNRLPLQEAEIIKRPIS